MPKPIEQMDEHWEIEGIFRYSAPHDKFDNEMDDDTQNSDFPSFCDSRKIDHKFA